MKKILILGLLCLPIFAREKTQGYCERGGQVLQVTSGVNSLGKVQLSYPSCTVTVYAAGTTSLSALYSDDSGTVQSNPFTAASDGAWSFYADDGRYDVRFSAGGIPSPFTRGDFQLLDWKFLQPGAGAVARPIKSVLADTVSVKDFGAVGNGVTNDGAAFVAAISAAIAQNKTLRCPGGNYLVSKRGTTVLPYDGLSHPYVFLITSPITIEGSCNITLDMADANAANVFVFQATNHVRISGITFTGTGTQSTQLLYTGSGVIFDRCNDCQGYDLKSFNMRGNLLAFSSTDAGCSHCFSSVTPPALGGKQGSHWGALVCTGSTFSDNTGYGGTTDGDMNIFGSVTPPQAVGNRLVNNKLYNYAFGDATRTIAFLQAQGFTVDSGPTGALMEGNYAYGYSIAYDVKTTATGTVVSNNVAEKSRIGIAVRLGENPALTNNTVIIGNTVRPMGGNTDPEPGPYAIFLQDAFGTVVANNVLEASWIFGSGQQNFIPIYATLSSSPNYCPACPNPTASVFTDGLDIHDNMIIQQEQQGGTYTYSDQPAIQVVGNSTNVWPRVQIHNNNFKFRVDAAITNVPVQVSWARDIEISGNFFGFQAGQSGLYTITCSHCVSLGVNNNHLDQFSGFLSVDNSTQINVSGNILYDQTRDGSGDPVPLIFSTVSSYWTIVGNQRIQPPGNTDNGRFFETSATGNNNIILAKNIMDQEILEDDWYKINGTPNANTSDIDVLDNIRIGPLDGNARTYIVTTGSLGGSALTAGTCTGINVTNIHGVYPGLVVDMYPSDITGPGDKFYYKARVSAHNNIVAQVCAITAGTPTATTYLLRVHQ